MTGSLLKLARACYRAIPLRSLRAAAYETYARTVRNRHVVKQIDGMTFDLDLGEVIDLQLYLEQYEPDVTAAIRRFTRPGMTILDIGANVGAHTLLFAKLTGTRGRVIAFEPTDFAFRKLERNLSLNELRNVEAVKIALSDVTVPAQNVDFRASWRTDGSRRDATSVVDFDRLDAWLEHAGTPEVDLVKIDVDGHEFPLLSGGAGMLRRDGPLMLMEAVGPHFDDDDRNPYRLLAGLEYRFWDARTRAELTIDMMRARLPRGDVGMTTSFNVIASREIPRWE